MPDRGRPRRSQRPQVYYVKLCLYPGEDDDLLAFLVAIPPRRRAAAVKAALRSGQLAVVQGELSAEEQMAAALDNLLI